MIEARMRLRHLEPEASLADFKPRLAEIEEIFNTNNKTKNTYFALDAV